MNSRSLLNNENRSDMTWATISAHAALSQIKLGTSAIDVRSSGEFATGEIPGSSNIAILNDDHRHQVGLCFKTHGQEKAIQLGHQLVDPLRPKLVSQWQRELKTKDSLVFCWRGGLRSQISAQWLNEAGVNGLRIEGGYKAMRALLLEQLAKEPKFVVLAGLTGAGKTEVLKQLSPPVVLDLEHHANHRGSSFGGFRTPQPSQQTFENRVALDLYNTDNERVVEDESSLIGRIALPTTIFKSIKTSQLIELTDSIENRVQRTFSEYVDFPIQSDGAEYVHKALEQALARIQKRLGGLNYQKILNELNLAFAQPEVNVDNHRSWIESLLRQYYDPLYERSIGKYNKKFIFSGDATGVRDFLTHRLSGRRT